MKIKIEEVQNGFMVHFEYKQGNALIGHTKVYRGVDVLLMLEDVGREVYGKKVQVIEK